MLNNHKLLLDNTCSICMIYGNCFVRHSFIDKAGLTSYQHIEEKYAQHINMEQAQRKIALYDIQSKSSLYGMDAKLRIIQTKHSNIAKALRSPIIYWMLNVLYSFISYNRKIIVRPSLSVEGCRCNPPFHKACKLNIQKLRLP